MRHRRKGKIFGRERNQRAALMRALATALFAHGTIKTTKAKARALRPYAERLITLSREDSVHHRRRAAKRLGPAAVKKLFGEIGPRFRSRPGGYIRISTMRRRKQDGAEYANIELV